MAFLAYWISCNNTFWKFMLVLVVLAVIIGGGILFLLSLESREPITPEEEIASFEECIEAGYPPLESYPRQCQTPDGKTFVEEIQPEDETIDWLIYRNEKYNYGFKYHGNHRVAHSIMEKRALEDETIRDEYREEYSVEDLVIITNLSTEEEEKYLEKCADFYGGCYASTNFSPGTISLMPFFTADRDIEAETKEHEGLTDEEKYHAALDLSDFRIEKTISGLEVRRWRLNWTMGGKNYEMASIRLPEKVLYPPIYYGDKDYQYLDEIIIRMQIGDDYEKDLLVLNNIISTFRFVKPEEEITEEIETIEGIPRDLLQKAFLVCEEYELEYHDFDLELDQQEMFVPPGPVYPIAFKGPERKEFLGLCGPGGYAGYNMLFVLDEEKNIILQKGPELSAFAGTRYYNFEDVTIIDIDGDGIEDIIYRESAWSMRHMWNKTHLYSPGHEEWFYVEDTEIDDISGACIRTITYSDNLKKEEFSAFKNFLKIEDPERCLHFGPG